jgi:hypothetical protein
MIGPILICAAGALLISSTKTDWRSTVAVIFATGLMALGMWLTVTP